MSTTNIALNPPPNVKEKEKHVHTYKKHPSRKEYSFCLGEECYSIVETKLLVGKRNRCKCGQDFILTREDLRRSCPRCVNCSNTKAASNFKKGKELIETLLTSEPKQAMEELMEEQEDLSEDEDL